jgi:hypothetical protein
VMPPPPLTITITILLVVDISCKNDVTVIHDWNSDFPGSLYNMYTGFVLSLDAGNLTGVL